MKTPTHNLNNSVNNFTNNTNFNHSKNDSSKQSIHQIIKAKELELPFCVSNGILEKYTKKSIKNIGS